MTAPERLWRCSRRYFFWGGRCRGVGVGFLRPLQRRQPHTQNKHHAHKILCHKHNKKQHNGAFLPISFTESPLRMAPLSPISMVDTIERHLGLSSQNSKSAGSGCRCDILFRWSDFYSLGVDNFNLRILGAISMLLFACILLNHSLIQVLSLQCSIYCTCTVMHYSTTCTV